MDAVTSTAWWYITAAAIEPTRLTQLNRHTGDGPGDSIGDCFRTCIACLLGFDRPDLVPHFTMQSIVAAGHAGGGDLAADVTLARKWLRATKGLGLAPVERDWAAQSGVPYKVTVRSKGGPWNHSVIAQHGEVIWCPTTGTGGYTLDDAIPETLPLVLCAPYQPGPDLALTYWRNWDRFVAGRQ